MTSNKRLFLTGASGLLGRAIFKKFKNEGWTIYGTAFSRTGDELHKIDLTNHDDVRGAVTQFKPNFVIHCAAQRFPEKVDSDPKAATQINVDSTKHLAEVSGNVGAPVLYISTDYVFDGTSPPYDINAIPNPLNLYGKTKLEGENATLATNKGNLVLRVPVLYGPVEFLAESAVTVLLESLLNTAKPCKLSHYERRRPSHVDDIALVCFQLASRRLQDESVHGIFHWCGKEVLTKYEMVLQMAEALDLPQPSHIAPNPDKPATATTPRPYDTTLDTSRLDGLGMGRHTVFKTGVKSALGSWVKII
ncbi:Methionine adenosyltransferase 2 subunit beta [Blattella germanica]|nr:Methionine adenosyltransferase 2 subunit beta [Blattella germanica]